MGWHGPMTHRQFRVWKQWLLNENNRPDRTDYYLMQIAAEIRKPNVKNHRRVKIGDFKLVFKDLVNEESMEAKVRRSKSAWIGVLGQPR